MAEVTNRTVEQLLRAHCKDNPATWTKQLALVQLLYNATPQSRTALSPYQLATGRGIKLPINVAMASVPVPAAQDFAGDLINLWRKNKSKLESL